MVDNTYDDIPRLWKRARAVVRRSLPRLHVPSKKAALKSTVKAARLLFLIAAVEIAAFQAFGIENQQVIDVFNAYKNGMVDNPGVGFGRILLEITIVMGGRRLIRSMLQNRQSRILSRMVARVE